MPVRVTPEPDNPFDSNAIKFECQIEDQWRIIGYVVRDALDAVHSAIKKKCEIKDTKFEWVKYIMHWSKSGPGWYADHETRHMAQGSS